MVAISATGIVTQIPTFAPVDNSDEEDCESLLRDVACVVEIVAARVIEVVAPVHSEHRQTICTIGATTFNWVILWVVVGALGDSKVAGLVRLAKAFRSQKHSEMVIWSPAVALRIHC